MKYKWQNNNVEITANILSSMVGILTNRNKVLEDSWLNLSKRVRNFVNWIKVDSDMHSAMGLITRNYAHHSLCNHIILSSMTHLLILLDPI